MLTNPDNTDIGAYETLKKRGFSPDDIAGLAEYLDEHRRKTMQPVLDEINAKFDLFRSEMVSEIAAVRSEMVSWKQAWVFVAILIGVAIVLPEALEKIVKQIQLLSGTAVTQDVSS